MPKAPLPEHIQEFVASPSLALFDTASLATNLHGFRHGFHGGFAADNSTYTDSIMDSMVDFMRKCRHRALYGDRNLTCSHAIYAIPAVRFYLLTSLVDCLMKFYYINPSSKPRID